MLLASYALSLSAQTTISAKAGLIDFTQGQAYLDNLPAEASATHYLNVRDDDVVRTEKGRVEILLGACTVMWIGEYSSFRMAPGRM
jgi:hypothetical protein